MARKRPADRAWLPQERALDQQRLAFLRMVDEVAPDVWNEAAAIGAEGDLQGWARRQHLGDWAAGYAIDRIRFRRWLPFIRGPIPLLAEASKSPPIYDPRIMRPRTFLRKVELPQSG